jgi:uncharacterized protein YozE (UPF0346 family)
MVSIEQSFSKDVLSKFKERGVSAYVEYKGSFIMNITAMEEIYSDNINIIIQEVENSKEIYKDIQFD